MKFSIVIPTRNREQLLRRTLLALAAQTQAPPFEVLVVDNGSGDGTAAVLAEPPAGLVLHALHEPVANRARARNRAVNVAIGEFLLFIDDDVIVPPHFVAAHAAAQDGSPAVVTGPIMNVADVDTRRQPAWYNHSRAYFCTCNASVPAAAVRSAGAFDEGFSGYGWEDTELGVRLRRQGLTRRFAWQAYVYHLKPPGWEDLAQAERRMIEKGRMARRFVDKSGSWRVRLATGDYALNHLRGAVLGPPWTMPVARALAQAAGVPAFVRAAARGHYLDGRYRAALCEHEGGRTSHGS